jgi:hypothetical protein
MRTAKTRSAPTGLIKVVVRKCNSTRIDDSVPTRRRRRDENRIVAATFNM